jgi:hypothetical protein
MENLKPERPPFLSALCALTFLGSGVMFVVYALASLFFEKASRIIIELSSWHTVEKISPIYFTILMVLNCLSLVGAIRMWKFHRDGLFIYTAAQLVLLFFPSVWLGWMAFSDTNAIFTTIFVVGYFLHWKVLKKRQ